MLTFKTFCFKFALYLFIEKTKIMQKSKVNIQKVSTNVNLQTKNINNGLMPRLKSRLHDGFLFSKERMPKLVIFIENASSLAKNPMNTIRTMPRPEPSSVLKFAVLVAIACVLLVKDIRFNFALNAPKDANAYGTILVDDQDKDKHEKDKYTQQVVQQKEGFGFINLNSSTLATKESPSEKEVQAYIDQFTPIAIREMKKSGIPASISMGQALMDSRGGTSKLAVINNNHFGLKCFSKQCKRGHCSNFEDDSHKDFFRKFEKAEDSWAAHTKILKGKRYRKLYKYKTNYKKWAKGLKKLGYATDKTYDEKLIYMIKKYQLYKLD